MLFFCLGRMGLGEKEKIGKWYDDDVKCLGLPKLVFDGVCPKLGYNQKMTTIADLRCIDRGRSMTDTAKASQVHIGENSVLLSRCQTLCMISDTPKGLLITQTISKVFTN